MKKSIIYITATLLTTLLMSCASAKIEYIEKPVVPEINFPIFPELENEVLNEDESVTVSADWIVRLAEYKIRIEEIENDYNDLKALYEGDYSRE